MASPTDSLAPKGPKRRLRAAVLALDVGMTATRACLLTLDRDDAPAIIASEGSKRVTGQGYCDCDFPSTAFPFDPVPKLEDCLGYGAEARSMSIPLKLYWIAVEGRNLQSRKHHGEVRKLRKLFPPISDLFREVNSKKRQGRHKADYQRDVFSRLRQIFIAHLKQVKRQAETRAYFENYEVLLREVWEDIPADDFHWLEESEAIGHYLLRNNSVQPEDRGTIDTFLLNNFGGHTMSSYTFELVWQNDGSNASFFTTSNSTCTYGGSEMHTLLVKEHIQEQIEQRNLKLTDEERQHLMKKCLEYYRHNLREDLTDESFTVRGSRTRNGKDLEFELSAETCRRFYAVCFGKPLQHLFEKIDEHARTHTMVVLSGGSFLNKVVLLQTKAKIVKARMKFIETDGVRDAGNRSAIACVGAALALRHAITVREFMDGAVFAVKDATSAKFSTALAILDRGVGVTDRYGPIFDLNTASGSGRSQGRIVHEVQLQKAYVFHKLGKYGCKGKCTVALRYEPENEEHTDQLVMTITPRRGGLGCSVTRTIPIFYCPGSCVVFVDQDNYNARQEDGDGVPARGRRNAVSNGRTEQDELDEQNGPDETEDETQVRDGHQELAVENEHAPKDDMPPLLKQADPDDEHRQLRDPKGPSPAKASKQTSNGATPTTSILDTKPVNQASAKRKATDTGEATADPSAKRQLVWQGSGR
ncbi:hypothetical protein ACCO45_008855 [Purpureocillium lilacinum]|uniref:Uncharacterized protein n=1 Tax=Purpureocillium lilacinum TaxID=33203 RepID=A0ACC4DKB2_PURLI